MSAPPGGQAVGVALTAALDDPGQRVLALVPDPSASLPAARLEALLAPAYRIGVVVPQVRRPGGHLAEAGVVRTDSGPLSRHLQAADGPAELTASDVDGSEYPWMAFRRDLLAGAVVDPDATAEQVAAAVLGAARAAGLRIVYEPGWQVSTSHPHTVQLPPPGPPGAAGPAGVAPPQVLVVAAGLPAHSYRSDDLFAAAVIDDLIHVVGAAALTVAVLDGYRCEARVAALRSRGVRVVTGPADWAGWFDARWGAFDHIFVASQALHSSIRTWLADSQPQAVRVLCVDALPFRSIDGLAPVTPGDETAGLRYFSDASAARMRDWLDQFNAVICARPADASYVSSVAGGRIVAQIHPPVERAAGHCEPARRSGLVLFANDGYDATLGNEDAALLALRSVVPGLRRRHPELTVSVVTDGPSPLLARSVTEAGFDLVPTAGAPAALAGARAVLALHQWGTGGRQAVLAAVGSGTPFVASPGAADDLDLGPLRGLSVFGDRADVRFRVERLLFDEDYWSDARRLVGQLAALYGPDARRDQLRSLLAATGRAIPAGGPDWPVVEHGPHHIRARPPAPAIRPGQRVKVSLGPVERPDSFGIVGDERYRLWHDRYGASPALLETLRHAISKLERQPLISVVMAVHDTDPQILEEAVESVRAQIYRNWQLCIADDASSRPDTAALLDALAGDPQIKVVRLGANQGIAGATNAALELAEGDFVAFMDHDDLLKPHALAQVARWLDADPELDLIYTDEDKVDRDGRLGEPHLKPDWSPDLLMSLNYISHLTVIRRSVVAAVGGLRRGFDGSQDYDLLLRVTELTERVAHIPEPLYSWRMVAGSTAGEADAKPYAADAARRALAEALQRRGRPGRVEATRFPTFYRTRYDIPGRPRVTIIIPTRDGLHLLEPCVASILERSTYDNYEIVIVDNQSCEGATLEFLARSEVRVVRYPHRFNYSRQMNLAAASTEADVLLFLNNDTEVITPEWIEALLEHAMRPEVGAVGGRLYYSDGRVQHEGILVGAAGGWAWNVDHGGYFARGDLVRNASAVTGACTMIRSTVYARIGGNDERLRVAYNDVDICLRARQAGLQVVYTPYAELYHHEGATRRGFEHDEDGPLFGQRWQVLRSVDPYHSPLFLNNRTDTAFLLAL